MPLVRHALLLLAPFRVLAMLAIVLALSIPAYAAKRVALVIGNDAYPSLGANGQLRKAVNDANAVGDTLETLGFEVLRGTNLDRSATLDLIDAMADRLDTGDTAFVFYAGHGVAIEGANYMLPTDIDPGRSGRRIKQGAVAEVDIVNALQSEGVKLGIVVLDACRDNPLSQGGTRSIGQTRGLNRIAREPRGIFGIYSAGIGQTALDGLGENDPHPNSVFTRALVPALSRSGNSLIDVAYEVADEVETLASSVDHDQTPAYYDQARGRDIFLAGREKAAPAPVATAPAAPAPAEGKPNLIAILSRPACLAALKDLEARTNGRSPSLADMIDVQKGHPGCGEFIETMASLTGQVLERLDEDKRAAAPDGSAGTDKPSKPVETAALLSAPSAPSIRAFPAPPPVAPYPAGPAGDAARLCDRLVAPAHDLQLPGDVRHVADIDVEVQKALSACEAAVAALPDHPRPATYLSSLLSLTRREPERARALCERAAASDYLDGHLCLGFDALRGSEPDWERAHAHIEKAARYGDELAVGWIAFAKMYGFGTPVDGMGAVRMLRKVETDESGQIAYFLGIAYEKGFGAPGGKPDFESAATLYRKAMARRVSSGAVRLALLAGTDQVRLEAGEADEITGLILLSLALDDPTVRQVLVQRGGNGMDGEVLRSIQRELRRLDLYRGAIDGEFGAGTMAAIERLRGARLPGASRTAAVQ